MMVRNLAMVGLAAWACVASADVYSRAYGPKGDLLTKRPTLQWQVWSEGGATIKDVWVKWDGERKAATYDQERRSVLWTPQNALAPGDYRVEMGAKTSDGMTVRKEWTLRVRSEASATFADPCDGERQIKAIVDGLRRPLGLDPVELNPILGAAAQSHRSYLVSNDKTGHYQEEGAPGFSGVTPAERLNAFGYVGGSSEVVFFGSRSLEDSVAQLFAAPYHRLAFMQPGSPPMGGSYGEKRLVIEFGESDGVQFLASPYDGETGVPTSWTGAERPNPLRLHPKLDGPPGRPIVFGRFCKDPAKLKLTSASLEVAETGEVVRLLVNDPSVDDELTDAVILIPAAPLKPRTKYQAKLDATIDGTERVRRNWTFVTGD